MSDEANKLLKEVLNEAYGSGRSLVSNLAGEIIRKLEEKNYSKRELDEHFKNFNTKLDGAIADIQEIKLSRSENKGVWSGTIRTITIVGSVILALISLVWTLAFSNVDAKITNIDNQVQTLKVQIEKK